jgi:hypothetical protein
MTEESTAQNKSPLDNELRGLELTLNPEPGNVRRFKTFGELKGFIQSGQAIRDSTLRFNEYNGVLIGTERADEAQSFLGQKPGT